jgi:AraC-like DNA-binding protein
VPREWVRYRRAGDQPLEAMHARFESHVYHRHSHETYSFGVTETGAQTFTCRGSRHTSAAGMVMAFNPDDPHDGCSASSTGFTYRIVHIGSELLAEVLAGQAGRGFGLPLFAEPVLDDPATARALRRLHASLMGPATALHRDERLAAAVLALHRRVAAPAGGRPPAASRSLAAQVRDQLHAAYLDDLDMERVARAAGHSRFAVYRAFHAAYGMAPSDYQRLLRVRAARDLLLRGYPVARAAAAAGFADQAHLTRWFGRYLGLTPGAFRRAVAGDGAAAAPHPG